MFTLLFEILDPPDPTPRKRYLFCNDPRHPAQVTACDPMRARSLAALLSHPEIVVTVIDYASAASIYTAIETTTPSRETQANGHPRQYDPIFQPDHSSAPITYAVSWPMAAAPSRDRIGDRHHAAQSHPVTVEAFDLHTHRERRRLQSADHLRHRTPRQHLPV